MTKDEITEELNWIRQYIKDDKLLEEIWQLAAKVRERDEMIRRLAYRVERAGDFELAQEARALIGEAK